MYAVHSEITHPAKGKLAIIARNEEKRLYRISSGVRQWTVSHEQLERWGWKLSDTPHNREINGAE